MFMKMEILEQPKVLVDCREYNREIIIELAKKLRKSDFQNVIIAARGTSDHAAIYAKYCIEILTGIPVSLAAPSVVSIYKRNMDYSKSLVIGISQSGEAQDVNDILTHAREQNACTIAITNFENSPLAKTAEHHLFLNAGVEKSVAATKTFLTQLFLIIELVAYWVEDAELLEALQRLPEVLNKQINESGEIEKATERYKFIDKCVVLARGVLYPIALEAALKIMETSNFFARAFAISDFYHGPLALIEKNLPVLILSSNDATKKDAIDVANRLQQMEADILVSTSSDEITGYANEIIRIPKVHPLIEPLHHVVSMQLFAYYLALQKGLNPDVPRNLKKVTITR